MNSLSNSETRNIWLFFLITIAWSWGLNLPRVLATASLIELPRTASSVLAITAVFGPAIAAFGLTYFNDGWAGMQSLWRRGWRFDFEKKWLVPILLLMPAAALLTVLILTLLGEAIPWQYSLPPLMIVPVFLIIYLTNALPEEYGWRGYVLDPMQRRWNALTASLILGAIWGLWHLPLHFISGTTQEIMPVWQVIARHMVPAILYTWLFNHTGGSVLAAALFHAAGNIAGATVPFWTTDQGRLISVVPFWPWLLLSS